MKFETILCDVKDETDFGTPLDPREDPFQEALRNLVDELYQVLTRLKRRETEPLCAFLGPGRCVPLLVLNSFIQLKQGPLIGRPVVRHVPPDPHGSFDPSGPALNTNAHRPRP